MLGNQADAAASVALQDSDTGIAAEAEKALVAHTAAVPGIFQSYITGSSPAGARLLQLAEDGSSTERMRVFALLTAAAATSRSNVEQLKHSGGKPWTINGRILACMC